MVFFEKSARRIFRGSVFLFVAFPAGIWAAYFPDGSLLRVADAPEVYVLEKGTRRWVPDPDTFNALGLNWDKILDVRTEEVASYPAGDRLRDKKRLPDGLLIRASDSPRVYVAEGGRKRWIPDPETFARGGWRWENIHVVPPQLAKRIGEGTKVSPPKPAPYSLDVTLLETPQAAAEEAEIRFRFAAPGVPGSARSSITYETFLAGFDTRWVSNGQNTTRRVTLAKGGDYIMYVRAKTKDGSLSPEPARFAFRALLSPRWKQIRISAVVGKETDPAKERLTLTNSSRDIMTLNGWTLEGKHGARYALSGGAELPMLAGQDASSPLSFGPGERLVVISGRSPFFFGGFRINKCLGYLGKSYSFVPAVPSSCPKPVIGDLTALGEVCQSYIQKLSACTIPQNITDTRVSQDSACLEYLRAHFSYAGCVRDYQYDADFYGAKEWRGYLELTRDAWDDTKDTIVLRDADGLVVDRYSY